MGQLVLLMVFKMAFCSKKRDQTKHLWPKTKNTALILRQPKKCENNWDIIVKSFKTEDSISSDSRCENTFFSTRKNFASSPTDPMLGRIFFNQLFYASTRKKNRLCKWMIFSYLIIWIDVYRLSVVRGHPSARKKKICTHSKYATLLATSM